MNKTLLDTDILSEILKGRAPNVAAAAARYTAEHQRLTRSAVSVLEIVRGYRRVRRDAKLDTFKRALTSCEVIPVDDLAASCAPASCARSVGTMSTSSAEFCTYDDRAKVRARTVARTRFRYSLPR